MTKLTSLAENILLNHIKRFHGSERPRPVGRPRSISFSFILNRILFVLSSGCQWSNLPLEKCSWKTIYHYFSFWSKHNIFNNAYDDLLHVYRKVKPPSKILIADTSFVKNVFGHDCVGASPFDRGRKATKVSAIVDQRGIPLVLTFHRGNRNDSRTLSHGLSKCKFIIPNSKFYADKIYDTNHCKDLLTQYQLENCISKKRQSVPKGDNRIRITVEHTFSWLDKYRRIILRYDSHVHMFKSFHYLACIHLLGNRIINTKNKN